MTMEDTNTKSKVLSSLLWKLMERSGTQGIQFIVQIVLARILHPNDYGTIALIAIFITIANVFVQSGFNTALIQKKDSNEEDFSSVFYLSLFIATSLYIVIFFIAPYIAHFYNIPELKSVLRVLAITLFFGAFNSIQNAVIARRMDFKKLFTSSLGAIIFSGIIGIVLAYAGFGVWALVAQQLINQLSVTVILWFTVKWRPRIMFSFARIKQLFSYGWKILVSSLIDTIDKNLRNLIVGKIYLPSMLGYYNRGDQFPQLIVSNINGSIQSVMLPTLSSEQDNIQKVRELVRRSIVTSSFLLFPMMIGLAVVGEPLIKIILTDKWLPCVPFMQIFCLSYALWPIHTANLQAINALGRSDIFLKLEIVKKLIGITILLISLYFGVYGIAIGTLISGIVSTFINAYPNLKLLNYSYRQQVRDIMPSLVLSIVMGGIVYCIGFLHISIWGILFIQVISGIVIYIALANIFKLECYLYLTNTLSEIIKRRKKE